ncbi:uncharacterized protein LAESUDRAFT_673255 [Laetiporus sulphureus 93-53]|uniref:Ubiquitin 3 binding protein But2 C-terminal domain-containing protein n=1 Tax=Laetiporus sulphureus 93-53 TaxID=1314785 RepID=A0A165GKT5_9APHY|nr:uncharacterized protein LAESUDRAFT_673255 [Laetiporus sulphureus 93-53]KZT10489.1 hypothetical protein LAESUDRAFT_673255 [Laetiporus sulphureus 93-53]
MASYLPLQRHDSEEVDSQDDLKESLLPRNGTSPEPVEPPPQSKWIEFLTLGLSLFVLVCACSVYVGTGTIIRTRDARGLRKPDQHPNLDLVEQIAKQGPEVIFPRTIVRANRAMPDAVYAPGPHVVLSDTDTMIYQWRMVPNEYDLCYIDAWVVPQDTPDLPPFKTWTGSGNFTGIQVWNVTTPPGRITSMSWNTRPERVSLLGTVSWIPFQDRKGMFAYDDGWQAMDPTPRFNCPGVHTVEIACEGCYIEFDQIFSEPPLAFDVVQLA